MGLNLKYNSLTNKYLQTYDLSNKYNLKNIYQKPQISSVVVHVPIKDCFTLDFLENSIEIRSVCFFYLFFSLLPFIRFKFSGSKKKNFLHKQSDGTYFCKIILHDIAEINLFLLSVLEFNKNILNINVFKNLGFKNEIKSKTLNSSFLILASDISSFEENIGGIIKSKEFNLNVSFIFKNLNLLSILRLKNVFPLWING